MNFNRLCARLLFRSATGSRRIGRYAFPTVRRDAPATAWRDRFRHEIAAVLAVKLLLLIFLKFAFFSHPQSPHGGMPSTAVARSLLDAPSAPPL